MMMMMGRDIISDVMVLVMIMTVAVIVILVMLW